VGRVTLLAINARTDRALKDAYKERVRQESLVAQKKISASCAGGKISAWDKLAVLMEEVGEVARELNESYATPNPSPRLRQIDGGKLRTELIQVAAVALAWAESLDPGMGAALLPSNPFANTGEAS
jgi:NTP pyrophosphatase (non-canonical NTP hydrolase)